MLLWYSNPQQGTNLCIQPARNNNLLKLLLEACKVYWQVRKLDSRQLDLDWSWLGERVTTGSLLLELYSILAESSLPFISMAEVYS